MQWHVPYVQFNHGTHASLKVWGIEEMPPPPRGGDIINRLLCREAFWITELKTVEPSGVNEESKKSYLFL